MRIEIIGIKFNHTPGNISTGALTIRQNYTRNITVPEWTPAKDGKNAKAAYSIGDTTGNKIIVQARLLSDTTNARVSIRTINGGVFGDVEEKEVIIVGDYISFALSGTKLNTVGIDILNIVWKWQYNLNDAGWVDFGTTNFMVYTVMSRPGAPWSSSNNVSDTQLPWTDVLDVTGVWARGAQTADEVQQRITAAVYNLGESSPAVIRYDTVSGATNYAYPDFRCTEFLKRLNGEVALGNKVNCTDCATIVSSFTNILGGRLLQSRMGNNFALRDLRAIGTKTWAVPFNGFFSYHEVAWENPCDENDNLYDACLQLNTNRGSGAPVALLPVNMLFGSCTDMTDYRTYLTTSQPDGCVRCIPRPATKQTRAIS